MSTPEVQGLLEAFSYAAGGFEELCNVQQPAAGADATISIGGDYDTRVLTAFARLVTDGNAANRELVVQYLDGDGNVFATHGANTTVAASLTADYFFSHQFSTPIVTVDSTALCPLTALFLEPGWSIKFHVVNRQAADQLSRIRVNLERFETGKGGYPEGMGFMRPVRARRRR